MQVFRLLSLQALGAGILSSGSAIDTVTNVSPELYPAITPLQNFTLANSYSGPQVMANTSGIAPTTGTNTQTGKLNRNASNAWATLTATVASGPAPGLMLSGQSSDYFTLVPPTNTTLVTIELTGLLQPGMGFNAGDLADGAHVLSSGQARNGAHVAVALDTQSALIYDTANQNLTVSVYLDGLAQHAITITHTGFADTGNLPIISVPQPAFSSSLYGRMVAVASTSQGQGAAASTITALWTVTAATSSTYTMTKTTPGGSPVAVGTTFNTGTIYDATGTVPGVSLLVNGPLVPGDTGTFTTDVAMAIVQTVNFYTSVGSAAGEYITPILDSGSPETQWFLYEHTDALFTNGAATTQVVAKIGQALTSTGIGSYTPPPGQPIPPTIGPEPYIVNANPDPTTNNGAQTYSTITTPSSTIVPLSGITLPSSGAHIIDAGLAGTPRGRYAQFQVQLAVNTQGMEAWARQLQVYCWIPTAFGNPLLLGKFGFPPNWAPGPLMQAYFGALLTFTADYFAALGDYIASFGLSTATGPLLIAKGTDLAEPHILGEPSSAYQNRLSTSLQAKNLSDAPTAITTTGSGTTTQPLVVTGTGSITLSPVVGEQGSLYSITQQVAQLVNGATPTVTSTVASATGLASASGGGVTVSQLAGRGIAITLPNPPYAGLPGLAYGTTGGVDNPAKAEIKQFCLSLMPAGTLFNPNSSTYLNFGPLG